MTKEQLQQYRAVICLSHKIVVYIPSEWAGQPISNRVAIVENVLSGLSDLCGGATSTEALGYFQSPGGTLVKERVTLAYAFVSDLDSILDDVLDLAIHLKAQARQESVALEIDNELYLI